jgi:diaminopimelate decarboxylase
LPGIAISGVDMHIGSQITEVAPFDAAFTLLAELVTTLRKDGHAIDHVDVGGGLGIPYRLDNAPPPLPDAYAEIVRKHIGPLKTKLVLEPGRLIAGNAGILLTRVLYVKTGGAKTFVVVDAGMNDLIRPTLYEAHHDIWPVNAAKRAKPVTADVVGPVCEPGDYQALGRTLPEVQSGDLVAVMTAGAYGATQSSTYNTRALVPEVLVRGAEMAVVRPRVEPEALIALDKQAPWL